MIAEIEAEAKRNIFVRDVFREEQIEELVDLEGKAGEVEIVTEENSRNFEENSNDIVQITTPLVSNFFEFSGSKKWQFTDIMEIS